MEKIKKVIPRKTSVEVERAWLERLISVADIVKAESPVKISAINYLLGYIESAEQLLKPSQSPH